MKAGKKKNKSTAEKITKFPVGTPDAEGFDDTEVDEWIREEIMREADELEARLNSDPKLIGVGASDDLFAKIVGSLKEQGIWEEDEEEIDAEEAENIESEVGKATEIKAADTNKTEESEEAKTDIEQKNSEVQQEKDTADVSRKKETEEKETEIEENNLTEERIITEPSKQETYKTQEQYPQLSEEDRRAMEYGYQMQQKDAEKKRRRKKRRNIMKRAGITAAALVAVFGVSMTSDANRRYVLEAWNTVIEKVGMRTGINYLEDEPVYLGDTKEEEAREEIREKLNIAPVKFGYLPEGWKFSSYEINQEADFGIFFYTNGEHLRSIYMKKNIDNNVSYYQLDGKDGFMQTIENSQNIEIQLQKTQSENKEMYSASFQKDDNSYYCNGDITYEEIKKIVKYLIILEDYNHNYQFDSLLLISN